MWSQVAVLSNGTTRPLTPEEVAEIAYHEEMEQAAADQEAKADEQRWLEFRAHCLQEEEDEVMKEALAESEHSAGSAQKSARVMVQVEGEGGRIVRSEIFNMVVKDGESLTYKIMVLPRNDPEVRRLRRQQAARDGETAAESESEISGASADTMPVDHQGRVLPPPPVIPNNELDAFMKTVEGKEYYRQWLAGDQTCRMVRERSGCGLLAKFFQRKVEEDEEQKMLQEALLAEAEAKKADRNNSVDDTMQEEQSKPENEDKTEACARSGKAGLEGDSERGPPDAALRDAQGSLESATTAEGQGQGLHQGRGLDQGSEEPAALPVPREREQDPGQEQQRALRDVPPTLPVPGTLGLDPEEQEQQELRDVLPNAEGLVPPATWPSFVLQAGSGTINLESQTASQASVGGPNFALPASSFTEISAEENQRELDFARAAGDLEEHPDDQGAENANNQGTSTTMATQEEHDSPAPAANGTTGISAASSTERVSNESGDAGLKAVEPEALAVVVPCLIKRIDSVMRFAISLAMAEVQGPGPCQNGIPAWIIKWRKGPIKKKPRKASSCVRSWS